VDFPEPDTAGDTDQLVERDIHVEILHVELRGSANLDFASVCCASMLRHFD